MTDGDGGLVSQGKLPRFRMTERFFYHSFPRPPFGSSSDWPSNPDCMKKGLKILESISEIGLMMTPETWELPAELVDGGPTPEPLPIYQTRTCFTAITPADLDAHSKCFGPFSLEFDISVLRRMGAMPVFYIAPTIGSKTEFGGCGISLLHRLREIQRLLERLHSMKQICSQNSQPASLIIGLGDEKLLIRASTTGVLDVVAALEHGIRDADMLRASIDSLSGLMYPSEGSDDDLLEYFQEKEWRITNGFVHSATGSGLCVKLSDENKAKVALQDPDYFNSSIKMKSGPGPIIDFCLVISDFDGKSIFDLCTRLVVPGAALNQAKETFPTFASKIISLESLAEG